MGGSKLILGKVTTMPLRFILSKVSGIDPPQVAADLHDSLSPGPSLDPPVPSCNCRRFGCSSHIGSCEDGALQSYVNQDFHDRRP